MVCAAHAQDLDVAPTGVAVIGAIAPRVTAGHAFTVQATIPIPDTATAYRCLLDDVQVGADMAPIVPLPVGIVTCSFPAQTVGMYNVTIASVYPAPDGVLTSAPLTVNVLTTAFIGYDENDDPFVIDPPCDSSVWTARYFQTTDLSGTFHPACTTAVNYNYGSGGPLDTGLTDHFSARWTGQFTFTGGSTTFTAVADDGIRVWLDNALVIDAWADHSGATQYQNTRTVSAGDHVMRVEYYENTGSAVAQVSWTP